MITFKQQLKKLDKWYVWLILAYITNTFILFLFS